ncbi:hypothetical protein [Kordia jejudonensis]|uniref:hypothetical protein n=1 Tax=Kordia jejudonensis TaxID=1348245 RepID=UPI0012E098D5|nr:hypothetical protein [Kordia jejudonensis]
MNTKNNILQTIHHLRASGQFVLYTNKPKVTKNELDDLGSFLAQEYENEALNYPFESPEFDEEAAIWGAKMIYFGAQFLGHRHDEPKDLNQYFEEFTTEITPASCLSADISLRFLPFIIKELEAIDFEDWLLKILKAHIKKFPYSAIGHDLNLEIDQEKLTELFQNGCFKTLFIDRVIEKKDISLTEHTIIHENIAIHLGAHKNHFWKAFTSEV